MMQTRLERSQGKIKGTVPLKPEILTDLLSEQPSFPLQVGGT